MHAGEEARLIRFLVAGEAGRVDVGRLARLHGRRRDAGLALGLRLVVLGHTGMTRRTCLRVEAVRTLLVLRGDGFLVACRTVRRGPPGSRSPLCLGASFAPCPERRRQRQDREELSHMKRSLPSWSGSVLPDLRVDAGFRYGPDPQGPYRLAISDNSGKVSNRSVSDAGNPAPRAFPSLLCRQYGRASTLELGGFAPGPDDRDGLVEGLVVFVVGFRDAIRRLW